MRKPRQLRNPSDPGCPGFYEHAEYMHVWALVQAEKLRTSKSISAICKSGFFVWFDAKKIKPVGEPAGTDELYAISQEIRGKTLRRIFYEADAVRRAEAANFKQMCAYFPSLSRPDGLSPIDRLWFAHRDSRLN